MLVTIDQYCQYLFISTSDPWHHILWPSFVRASVIWLKANVSLPLHNRLTVLNLFYCHALQWEPKNVLSWTDMFSQWTPLVTVKSSWWSVVGPPSCTCCCRVVAELATSQEQSGTKSSSARQGKTLFKSGLMVFRGSHPSCLNRATVLPTIYLTIYICLK